MNDSHVLLMTDLVDSTALAARLGDAAAAALWHQHDRFARDLLRQWGGREIDKSDGFLLLFASVADALGYALAYHRGLAALPEAPKARAGVHAGALVVRENEADDVARGAKRLEVDGVAKPTTARIMALAIGGQTLLSQQARAALGATAWRVQSHGHWRLAGLEEPVELFEAGEAGSPFLPPPDSPKAWRVVLRNDLWLPRREVRHSLPAERDAFIGRREVLHELADRLEAGARLVSLLGTGGTGKTRLALRFGWLWLGSFPGGVWFCDLSQASTLDGVVHSVAQGLGITLGVADPLIQIGNAIAGRGRCLVVVDNFEQVARHAEATLGRWLERAIEACFVATTREVLGVGGEEAMVVDPLPPSEGMALFVRRAQAATHFDPGPDDLAAIAPLVKLLDGLPLAIELAAARVRVMPPAALLDRMGERFRLLTSTAGRRDRQATMRATFAWSWDLLTAPEKAALAQLTVFEGGFTLAGAEEIIDLSAHDSGAWAPDMVQALVDKSLVRKLDRDRFDLLSSVHAYVVERARSDDGADADHAAVAARQRHWRRFARLAGDATAEPAMVEIENLVVACRRALAAGDAAAAVATLDGAWALLKRTGPYNVGADLARNIREALALDPLQSATTARVEGGALFMLGRGDEAESRLKDGIRVSEGEGLAKQRAQLLSALGEVQSAAGRFDEAQPQLEAALVLARELQDRALQCWVTNALGALWSDRMQIDEARRCYTSALELAREIGDTRWQGGLLGNLGSLHHGAGQLEQAVAYYREALSLTAEAVDRRWEGNTRCNLGLALHDLNQPAAARQYLQSALESARYMGHARLECSALCNLGMVAEAESAFDEARACHEQAASIARGLHDSHAEGSILSYLSVLYARAGLSAKAQAAIDSAARLLENSQDRVAVGLLACSRAGVAHYRGDSGAAGAALAQARSISSEIGAMGGSELVQRIARMTELLAREPGAGPRTISPRG